jgi:isocitrate dehydrogenase
MKKMISVAEGDGIGPEITKATLQVLRAANLPLEFEMVRLGKEAFSDGHESGIPPETWAAIRKTKVLLKAPITTPQGGGYKSLNVSLRKALGLYANVRPSIAYSPFIKTKYPDVNLVIVRENEEDLYTGIEYQQSNDSYSTLKVITKKGSERIIRYAFEYAKACGRKKVTAMSKDNIMKLTDGLFHRVFNEIGKEYPEIEKDHYIIDIGAAHIATDPGRFDIIVTLNLYGDIVSDIASQVAGSVGLSGSSNIGSRYSMFEAIHGSAPDIAGKGIANPTGLMMGGVMMLHALGYCQEASLVHNAILKTIEDGIHTADLFDSEYSVRKVDTMGFADAVVMRLGTEPSILSKANYKTLDMHIPGDSDQMDVTKELVGVDVFIDWRSGSVNEFLSVLQGVLNERLMLTKVYNRGLQMWPDGDPEVSYSDVWLCRFERKNGLPSLTNMDVIGLCSLMVERSLDLIKTEHLYTFNGESRYWE